MDVGRPNQYLFGPNFVISQDINNVDNVENIKTTGNDPANREKLGIYNVKIKSYSNMGPKSKYWQWEPELAGVSGRMAWIAH